MNPSLESRFESLKEMIVERIEKEENTELLEKKS